MRMEHLMATGTETERRTLMNSLSRRPRLIAFTALALAGMVAAAVAMATSGSSDPASEAAAARDIPATFDTNAVVAEARTVLEADGRTFIVAPPREAIDGLCTIVMSPQEGNILGCHAVGDLTRKGVTLVGRPGAQGDWTGIGLVADGVDDIRVNGEPVERDGQVVVLGRRAGGTVTADGPGGGIAVSIPTAAEMRQQAAASEAVAAEAVKNLD